MFYLRLLVQALLTWYCVQTIPSFEVEIISVLSFDRSVAPSLDYSGAPLEVAVKVVNQNYDGMNMSAVNVAKMRYLPCPQSNIDAVTYASEYYYKNFRPGKCYAFLGTGCHDATGMSKLARDLDLLLFITTFPSPELPVVRHYPNTFLMGPNYDTLAVATAEMLKFFDWRHVTIILDSASFTTLYAYTTVAIKAVFDQNPNLDVDIIRVNATDAPAVADAFRVASIRSRVMFLMSAVSVVLRMLRIASSLGMGNGEYAFVTINGQQLQPYGFASMFDYPDDTLWNVTRSLVYITLAQARRESNDVSRRVKKLALEKYNTTYPEESPLSENYVLQGTMDAVEVLGAAVMEARSEESSGDCPASTLTRHIRGRSFNLSRGEIFISKDGKKRIDVVFYELDILTRRMVITAIFNGTNNSVDLVADITPSWVTGLPPLDTPLCGFLGNAGPCGPQPMGQKRIVIGVAVTLIVIAIILLRVWRVQKKLSLWVTLGKRWLISADDLSPFSQTTASFGSGQGIWKDTPVWLVLISRPVKVDVGACCRCLIFLQHTNLVRYYGLSVYPGYLAVVTEFCPKGSLADFLHTPQVEFDFKLSFVVDLVQGLVFLQTTAGPHGHLRLSSCFIDGFFTLKIGNFGLHELRKYLGQMQPDKAKSSALWTAPELSHNNGKKSISGDVFSLGLIMAMVFLEPNVLTIDITGPVKELANQECPPRLLHLIQDCVAVDPHSRPALQSIWKSLIAIFPDKRLKNSSVAERIIRRFALHTSALEAAVEARTVALQQERDKCDTLLQQLLPGFVVERLRNQQIVEPCTFASVTIYFSELEGFMYWVASSATPDEVLRTLSNISNSFDQKISDYAVQKVEEVGDCYMVVSGIPERPNVVHTFQICSMALGLQSLFTTTLYANCFKLRCGIHTGPCASGIVGSKVPRYLLFGDAVNVASRVQTSGAGGRIHLSQDTAALVGNDKRFCIWERGLIELKETVEGERPLIRGANVWHFFLDAFTACRKSCATLDDRPTPNIRTAGVPSAGTYLGVFEDVRSLRWKEMRHQNLQTGYVPRVV